MTLSDFFVKVIDVFGKPLFMRIFEENRSKKVVRLRWIVCHHLHYEQKISRKQLCGYLNKKRTSINQYLTNYAYEYKYNEEFRNLADKVLKE